MKLQYTILDPVPILCVGCPTGTPAAAVLNKKCILRTGTVCINLLANVDNTPQLPQ